MDPGLITLGAITVGATLLPRFFKTRNEGFDVIPTDGYPEVVQDAKELFNKLTLSSDPRAEAVRVNNLSVADQNAYKSAVDAITSGTQVNITRDGVTTTQTATDTPIHIPGDDSILRRIAFCQNTPITDTIFQNETFKRDCGVCVTKGTTADNRPFTGRKGLFILPDVKDELMQTMATSGETYTKGKPSYGFCEGATAGVDHNYTFAVNEKELKPFSNRIVCKESRQLDGDCATCLKDGAYTFVGKTDRSLDPITFIVLAKNAIIEASLGGTKPDFQFPNNVQTFVAGAQATSRFSIVLTEGAFLNFNITGFSGRRDGRGVPVPNPQVVAEFWGIIEFINATGGIERIPLDRILLKDEATGTAPRFSREFTQVNGIFCRKMLKRAGQQSMILSGQVPFLLINNAPFEGVDCRGSLLQTLGSSVEKFGGDPCYKPSTQGPGTWTDACLRDRIQTLGCTTNGKLFENPSELRSLTMTQLIQTVQTIASRQYSDNDSSVKCNGRNISTPCDPFINFDPEETPELSNQCIEFLYFNRGLDKPNIGPTYTGPTNTFFSVDANNKRIMCLPGAQLDPATRNTGLLNFMKQIYRTGFQGTNGLNAVKRFMDVSYNGAINPGLNANLDSNRGGRKDFIERCFATLANIPENVLPDAKLPNARYCRVRYPPGRTEWIQISQVAVFDNREQNVAFGKPTSTNSLYQFRRGGQLTSASANAVDGQLRPRGSAETIGALYTSNFTPNSFWMVDFTKVFPIKRLEYYNRSDGSSGRANGMLLELLDERMTVIWSQTLDSNQKQVYYTFLKNFNV